MRPILHGDVIAAARVLRTLAAPRRARAMAGLLRAADLAEAHRRRTGRAHPDFGTGSLMAAAAAWRGPPEPDLSDPDYLACLVTVLVALRRRALRPTGPRADRARCQVTAGPDR